LEGAPLGMRRSKWKVGMSVVRLGSHKAQVRGHGICAREEKEPPNKNDFLLEINKGGA
jgi:hypothetical protein